MIVANSDSNLFLNNVTANTMGASSFPAFNSTGDLVSLRDQNGNLIDAVNYTDDWYQDDDKDGDDKSETYCGCREIMA